MLTKIEVFSAQPDAPELALGGFFPNLDPVQVLNITGLGPVKADIRSTQFATGDGELYQGASVGKRNIVMTLGFNPNWVDQTVSSLRQLLYRYFLTKAWTKLRFHSDDMPTVDIEGYVESCEPNHFSQDPEMVVSVICPKPDFIEVDATIFYGTVDDGDTLLEVNYAGTVATGFEVRVVGSPTVPAYTGPLAIRAQQEPEAVQEVLVDPLTINGAKFYKMSSLRHGRRVVSVLHADNSTLNLLPLMTAESVWPIFKPGMNLFSVASDAEGHGLAWTMAYFNRYGGL